MQRLSYPTETVSSNKITQNIIFPSFKNSPRKPLGRRETYHDFNILRCELNVCSEVRAGPTVVLTELTMMGISGMYVRCGERGIFGEARSG